MPTTDTYIIDPPNANGTTIFSSLGGLSTYLHSQALYPSGDPENFPNFLDLVTADKRLDIRVKSPVQGTDSFLQEWLTDATRFITVTAHSGFEHVGVFDSTKPGWFCEDNIALIGAPPFTRFEGLTFYSNSGAIFGSPLVDLASIAEGIGFLGTPIHVDRCIFRIGDSPDSDLVFLRTPGGSVKNCLFYCDVNEGTSVIFVKAIKGSGEASSNVDVYNNTFVNTSISAGSGSAHLLATGANVVIVSNNNYLGAVAGSGAICYVTASSGTVTKGANDATYNTEATTVALRGVSIEDAKFENTTFATADFHLRNNSSKLARSGATIASVTTDFEGEARSASYSIGADEL